MVKCWIVLSENGPEYIAKEYFYCSKIEKVKLTTMVV